MSCLLVRCWSCLSVIDYWIYKFYEDIFNLEDGCYTLRLFFSKGKWDELNIIHLSWRCLISLSLLNWFRSILLSEQQCSMLSCMFASSIYYFFDHCFAIFLCFGLLFSVVGSIMIQVLDGIIAVDMVFIIHMKMENMFHCHATR